MSKKRIIFLACLDVDAGNNPEALGLVFHHQCPTFINAHYQAATNVVDRD